MKLYELTDQYRADVAKLQDLDLPPEAVLDTIDGMQGEITEKIKAVLIVSMELDAEAAVRKEHALRMTESAKSIANRAEGLRSYAQIAIQNSGLALPLKYPEFNVNLVRNPPSCEVTENTAVPMTFKTTTVTVTLPPTTFTRADATEAELREAGANMFQEIKAVYPTATIDVEFSIDKKALLAALKAQAERNTKRPEGEAHETTPGARMNPTGFRVAIK